MSTQVHSPRYDQSPLGRGLGIAQVARNLGVPQPTLRSWERRYGVPSTTRPAGRHRRYSPAELHELRLMRDEVARGSRASEAALTVRRILQIDGPAAVFIERFLQGTMQLDPRRVEQALREATADLGWGRAIDEVMLPALRRTGTWWTVGGCDAAPEATAVRAIRGWLRSGTASFSLGSEARTVALTVGPRDAHTIGLEALALLLRAAGWRGQMLSPRGDPERVCHDVTALQAAGVVVVSTLATGRRDAEELIRVLGRAGHPTFYAGSAFSSPALRRRNPGIYLGDGITEAAQRIIHGLRANTGSPDRGH